MVKREDRGGMDKLCLSMSMRSHMNKEGLFNRKENLFRHQTKSPNILLPRLGLSRRNGNNKLTRLSQFAPKNSHFYASIVLEPLILLEWISKMGCSADLPY